MCLLFKGWNISVFLPMYIYRAKKIRVSIVFVMIIWNILESYNWSNIFWGAGKDKSEGHEFLNEIKDTLLSSNLIWPEFLYLYFLVIHWSRSGVGKLFLERAGSKYFRLGRLHGYCYSYSWPLTPWSRKFVYNFWHPKTWLMLSFGICGRLV